MSPNIRAGMIAAQAQSVGFRFLRASGAADPGTDARVLLAHSFGIARDKVVLIYGEALSDTVASTYAKALEKRASRAPVSHITGQREFYGRTFKVGPSVLDPRPETELLIEVALEQEIRSVLDLGTGSGCILLTLLHESPSAWGVGIEKSKAAWKVAAENRDAMSLSKRAVLRLGDWYEGVSSAVHADFPGFDLIVSNPPYISASDMADLLPEVRDHEPREALTDESDGLNSYRAITSGVMEHLTPGGRLIVEIAPAEARAVTQLFERAGLQNVRVAPDLDGRDRVVIGHRVAHNIA
ncbi:MAG: peptide chain release factor N(5)-glutamine methyltransferase [Paracoccaceae bacterium]